MKKIVSIVLLSSLLLVSCGEETSNTEENNSAEISQSTEESTSEETSVETTEDTEENTNETDTSEKSDSEGSDLAQVGDVEESDGMIKTITGTNYGINETSTSGPFEITILNAQTSQLEITDPNALEYFESENLSSVVLEIEVKHTSDDTNSIYPDQGYLVINDGNQIQADILLSDLLGDEYYGKSSKKGMVIFTYECNSEEINNVRYIVEGGFDENFDILGENIEFSIDF